MIVKQVLIHVNLYIQAGGPVIVEYSVRKSSSHPKLKVKHSAFIIYAPNHRETAKLLFYVIICCEIGRSCLIYLHLP